MIYRDFKGEKISALAEGTMRLPTGEGGEADINVEAAREMLEYAIASGVNYFDTAYGYHNGNSERVVGEILSAHPRESFFLTSKFPGYDPANWPKVKSIFPEQLEKCGVDYFDFYLFHNVCELNIDAYLDDARFGIYGYLTRMRDEGKIRHLGCSIHGNMETTKRFLDAYGEDIEFAQIQLNWFDWSFQDAASKVRLLNELNIPIWVMEPMRGGKLATLSDAQMATLKQFRPNASAAEWALRYLQSTEGVTVILTGASTLEQLKENIACFEEEASLTDEEKAALYKIAAEMSDGFVPCTACHYCVSHCPQGLDIPNLISLYNQRKINGEGDFLSSMALAGMPPEALPENCIGCGSCAEVCPQVIEIPEIMSDFVELMKDNKAMASMREKKAKLDI